MSERHLLMFVPWLDGKERGGSLAEYAMFPLDG